ncbi:MAG: ABC transporter permease subunit [Kiritimatiellae bacterium]|nr:ABC transporter permease subunit [Kiritimatiellia bacterium]
MSTVGKPGSGRRPVRLAFGIALAAAAAWSALMLLVAGLAPKDVEEVVRFRTLTRVAEPATADEVDPSNDRGLVLVRGVTSSPEPLADPLLPSGDSADALALVRKAEMFQWVERPAEGAPGVRYEGAWRDSPVDSSAFQIPAGHENPKAFPAECAPREFVADEVRIGKYLVGPKSRLRAVVEAVPFENRKAFVPVAERPEGESASRESPRVGDVRLSWLVVPHTNVTVVAAQRADKIPAAIRGREDAPRAALVPQEGGAIAEKLFLCAAGDRSAEEMFAPFRAKHALPDGLLWRAHVFATEIVSPSTLVQLLGGLLLSMALFALTVLFSLPLGLGVALARMSRCRAVSGVARVYISIVRGTPLMLQLLFVYFGPYYLFGLSLSKYPAFAAAVIAFSLNYAAYFAEIYRAGIESIPVGQHEAAQMLGFTKRDAFLRIVLPQVAKRILPPVTNEVITLVKDTSLAQVISVVEMFTIAKQLGNAQASIAPLVVAGVFYYLFNWLVASGMERIEKKLSYYR